MNAVALPIVIPLVGSALCLAVWGRGRLHAWVAHLTALGTLAASVFLLAQHWNGGVTALHLGGWPSGLGIALAADPFAASLTVVASLIGLATTIEARSTIQRRDIKLGYYPLSLALIAACNGAFLAADLFNLFVWFELMLLSSFVLLTLNAGRPRTAGAVMYVVLNLISSALFLIGVGIAYGVVGTLNMADLALRLDALDDPALATLIAAPLMLAFATKAAVFPLFFWLPASYHHAPTAIAALFAGLLTKVGVYAMIRALTLMFDQEWAMAGNFVLVIAGLTMVTGVFGALAQDDIKRILSFHIVSQIGYMLMGLGVAMSAAGSPEGITGAGVALSMAGAVFYMIHHMIVKTNLFLCAGLVERVRGTTSLDAITRSGGLIHDRPFMAAVFILSALALAGIPALSGFWAKLVLVRGGIEASSWWIVGTSLFVSALTLMSMMKIWTKAFWGSVPESPSTVKVNYAPSLLLGSVSLVIGFGAPFVFDLSQRAADQLLDPSAYIETVGPDHTHAALMEAFNAEMEANADAAEQSAETGAAEEADSPDNGRAEP